MILIFTVAYLVIAGLIASIVLFSNRDDASLFTSVKESCLAGLLIIFWPALVVLMISEYCMPVDNDDDVYLIKQYGGWCGFSEPDEAYENDSLFGHVPNIETLRLRKFCLRQRLFDNGKLVLRDSEQHYLSAPKWMTK